MNVHILADIDTDLFPSWLIPLLVDQVLPFWTKQKQVEMFGIVGFSWGSWVIMKECTRVFLCLSFSSVHQSHRNRVGGVAKERCPAPGA